MVRAFTASHRGGSGQPLVCIHGLADTWRTWELVLPELERHHEVLAVTLAGAAPYAEAMVASAEGRRAATQYTTKNFEHIPAELLAHQIRGAANCEALTALIDFAAREGWSLDAESIGCPVRIVWGTEDKLLPWPAAAARFRSDWVPQADWVQLEGIGHCPQLDTPLETAQLILGFTS